MTKTELQIHITRLSARIGDAAMLCNGGRLDESEAKLREIYDGLAEEFELREKEAPEEQKKDSKDHERTETVKNDKGVPNIGHCVQS